MDWSFPKLYFIFFPFFKPRTGSTTSTPFYFNLRPPTRVLDFLGEFPTFEPIYIALVSSPLEPRLELFTIDELELPKPSACHVYHLE